MADCIFCNILENAKPGQIVHQDDACFVLRDIHPQAPTHLLVIPKKHYGDLTDMEGATDVIGKMYGAAIALARQEKIDDGFRTVINVKPKGGQTVFHVHMHVLGGKQMGPGLAG